jgi:hypothetical protein
MARRFVLTAPPAAMQPVLALPGKLLYAFGL